MCLKGIKLVTFDVTNTLLKFRIPSWQYYALVAQDHGYTVDKEKLEKCHTKSYQIMWNKYPNFGKSEMTWNEWWIQVVKKSFEGQLPADANVENLAVKLIDDFRTHRCWDLASGVFKLLSLLQKHEKKIGVISNFDPSLPKLLCSVKLNSYFDFTLTSYDVGYSKPDKNIFDHALRQSNILVKPSEALHIGDDLSKDYEGAKAAGWHALLVAENNNFKETLPPEHVFESLDEVISAIESNKLKL